MLKLSFPALPRASFSARATELGLEVCLPKLQELGFTTFANYGFDCGHVPGGDDKESIAQVCKPLAGDNVQRRPALRRLYFEAYTHLANGLKNLIEQTNEDAPKNMSIEEVNALRGKVVPRLRGLDTDWEHDLAQSLINLAFQILLANCLKCIAWTVCPSRRDERRGVNTLTQWKPDSSGRSRRLRSASRHTPA